MTEYLPWLMVALPPILGAFIGWFTNWLAVVMLFKPQKKISVLGLGIQGLIPKRRAELALSIAETVERELFSYQDIAKLLQSPEFTTKLQSEVGTYVERLLAQLKGSNPMVGMFLRGDLEQQASDLLSEQIKEALPMLMEKGVSHLEGNFDIKSLVAQRIDGLDLNRLERLIKNVSSRELKMIEYLGGVLGFIVGLAQVALMQIGKVL